MNDRGTVLIGIEIEFHEEFLRLIPFVDRIFPNQW